MRFPLEHGYISRFFLSDVRKEEVKGKPFSFHDEGVIFQGHFQEWKQMQNPVRTEYLSNLRTKIRAYPSFERIEPKDGVVDLWGTRLGMHLHFPFGNPFVSVSGDWILPCGIATCACTYLESARTQDLPVLFSVSGGAHVWVNGVNAFAFYPYERNRQCSQKFVLPLKHGENFLVVEFDDYAERDTECGFSIKVLERDDTVVQNIPTGTLDGDALRATETAMESLHFARDHFTEGNILLDGVPPFEKKEFVVSLVGATEENAMLGIFHRATATFAPSSSQVSFGPCEDFPLGFLRCELSTEYDGVHISTVLGMENFPLSLQPKPAETVRLRKQQAWEFLAKYGEQNANRAVALAHVHKGVEEIETILQRQIAFINNRSDCSDFYLSYFPHLIRTYRDSGMIKPQTLEKMKHCILGFRYWFDEPGDDSMCFTTENHALMFHVCQLISGELYPDEVFTDSGMTGVQMQEKAMAMLRVWFASFFANGFSEWNSPPYLPIDSLGFASLYAQTTHPEMKALAKRALDWMFRLLSITSFFGVFSTTSGRTYIKELFANRSNCPSSLNYIGAGIGYLSHAGKGIVPLCFSDYEPDPEDMRCQLVPDGKAMLWRSTQGAGGYVDIYVYKTAKYLISSAVNFHPGEKGSQEDVFHLLFGPDAQVWINHPGEFALNGSARPSYWSGSGYLPRVNQYRGFASVIFNVSEDHPVSFTHVYLPVVEFETVVQKGKWVFAFARNGGMLGLYNSNGLHRQVSGQNTDREFKSLGRRSIYLVRCAIQDERLSFERFMDNLLSASLSICETVLGYDFVDPEYGRLQADWGASLTRAGKPVSYKGCDQNGEITWFDENHER